MKKSKFFGAVAALSVCGAGLVMVSPSVAGEPHKMAGAATTGDIVDVAVKAGSFKTLAAALQAAGLVEALRGSGPFTVFAPTDEAFAKLPAGTVEALLKPENKEKLAAILKYHVVSGRVTSSQIGGIPAAATLEGQLITPNMSGDSVTVNGAKVIKADVPASNGVIHVIDTVLIPESRNIPAVAASAGSFKTLLAAVGAAGLSETLSGTGPFTVLAPTDEAFAKIPPKTLEALLKPENKATLTAVLTYHVIAGRVIATDAVKAGSTPTVEGETVAFTSAGGKVSVNVARVLSANLDTSNGVIHVIDTVLIPAKVADAIQKLSMTSPRDIAQTAIARGVPLFNNGQPSACAAVYEVALVAMTAIPAERLDCAARSQVAAALEDGRATHDMKERAWVFRRALDKVMDSSDMTTSR